MNKPPECEGCPLHDAEGPVFGEGPTNAPLVFVGEAPAGNEVLLNRPFVGGAGRVLSALLAQAHIDRGAAFIHNTICCRIPRDKLTEYEHAEAAAKFCSDRFLRPTLEDMRDIRVVVPMGTAANWALTGRGEVTAEIYPYAGYPWTGGIRDRIVVPVLHPAALMRDRGMWQTTVYFLTKAARYAREGWKSPPENFVIAQTPSDVEGFAEVVLGAKLEVVVDIENPGGVLWELGFSTVGSYAIAIPFLRSASERWWREDHERQVITAINDILRSPDVTKIVHFGGHERFWLAQYGFELAGRIIDTHVLHAMVYPPLPHTLGFVCSVHTERREWKTLAPDWSKASEEVDK